jgi:hypothetical protein
VEFRRAFRRKRRQGYRTWTDQLKAATPLEAIKILAATQKRKNRKSNTSTLANDPPTIQHVRNHFATVSTPPHVHIAEHPPTTLDDTPKLFPQTEPIPSIEEIAYEITRMPNNKAPGTDNLKTELLKPAAPHISKWLFYLFNAIHRVGITPTEWNKVTLIPLWKGKGAPDDPTQHRPISLTQHCRKQFERCIMPTLLKQAGPLDKAQGSNRKDWRNTSILDGLPGH